MMAQHDQYMMQSVAAIRRRVALTLSGAVLAFGGASCGSESESGDAERADVPPATETSGGVATNAEASQTKSTEAPAETDEPTDSAELATGPIEVLDKWRLSFAKMDGDSSAIMQQIYDALGDDFGSAEPGTDQTLVALMMTVESLDSAVAAQDVWSDTQITVTSTETRDDKPGDDIVAGSKKWFGLESDAALVGTDYLEVTQNVYRTALILEVDKGLYDEGKILLEIFDQRLQNVDDSPEPRFETTYLPVP